MKVFPRPYNQRQKYNGSGDGYKIVSNEDETVYTAIDAAGLNGFVIDRGGTYRMPEKTFEQDCLAGRDLPILCDKCSHALIKLNKCDLPKNTMTKIKFRQLQESDYCKDFEDIILENT